jgi:transposase
VALARNSTKERIGASVTYTLNQWAKLRRCFDYAEVELSNNLAENSMRPIALGRKNWLHVAVPSLVPKWQRFFRSSNPAVGSTCR